jgi:hypothetical protein
MTFPGSDKAVDVKIIFSQQPAKLQTVTDVIIPPLSGQWVTVVTPKKDPLTQIPNAVVYVTSDPWCAKERGILTQQSILNLERGETKVFLVNTNAFSMRIKKRNTVALTLPDAPEGHDLIPVGESLYDLNDLKVGGEDGIIGCVTESEDKSNEEFNCKIERYQALCTLFGIQSSCMTADDLLLIKKASGLDASEVVHLVAARRKALEKSSPTVDQRKTDLSDFEGCLYVGTSDNGPRVSSLEENQGEKGMNL